MRCKPCLKFYAALEAVCTSDPSLRSTYGNRFTRNCRGRRAFIRRSHEILPDELIQWIKKGLENEESRVSHLSSHSRVTQQGIADNSEALQVIIADCLASQLSFTQEHIHCHIARYNPSMQQSDSREIARPPLYPQRGITRSALLNPQRKV